MRVLLIGGGGREAALAWRIAQSPTLSTLFVTHDNPGFPHDVVRIEGDPVRAAVANLIDLVVVGPEAPLVDGVADRCAEAGIACFGPVAAGARLEASKAWTKEILAEAGVPTARFERLERSDPQLFDRVAAWASEGDGLVLKADGLAAGKGVVVCLPGDDAVAAARELLGRIGAAADVLVLEERMTGPEISIFGMSDGRRVVGLPSSRDHKRIGDGDTGPNTGGMGAIAPDSAVGEGYVDEILDLVHRPVIDVLRQRGVEYRGVLYAGIMRTPSGPRVLEFNVRFGDPECQALMTLWDDDLLLWLFGAASGVLPAGSPRFRDESACCVVLASRGYPLSSDKGVPIPPLPDVPGGAVFVAGAEWLDEQLVTSGGRVLGVTASGANLEDARRLAYAAVDKVRFSGCQVRADIGITTA